MTDNTGTKYYFSPRSLQARRSLSVKQLAVLDILLQGRNKEEAARVAGVDPSTIWRWLKAGTVFEEAYALAKADFWTAVQWRLKKLTAAALDVIEDILVSDDNKIRLRAAELVLKYTEPTSAVSEAVDLDQASSRHGDQIRENRERQRYYRPEHFRPHECEIDGRTKTGRLKWDRSEFYKKEKEYTKLANGQT